MRARTVAPVPIPDDESPPSEEWRRDGSQPPGGCVVHGEEECARPSMHAGWAAVFGRCTWSHRLAFRRYEHPSGAYVMRSQQYDGFERRPYIAAGADGRVLTARPRTTRRGTHLLRQTRWFGSPATAMAAALSVATPEPRAR